MTVYIGIDWSQTQHDVSFLNEAGTLTQYGRLQADTCGTL